MTEIEKIQLFNKILYIIHCILVDIRCEAYCRENADVKKIAEYADAFEVIPMYMFLWTDDKKEIIDEIIENLQKKYHKCQDFLDILEMDYKDFLHKYLSYDMSSNEQIIFPQNLILPSMFVHDSPYSTVVHSVENETKCFQ